MRPPVLGGLLLSEYDPSQHTSQNGLNLPSTAEHLSMQERVTITSAEFTNFKAMHRFSVRLQGMNVLVGPNNSGKSTVIGAFRALSEALKRPRAKGVEIVPGPEGEMRGYTISSDVLPISLENVHTDYQDLDSSVVFRLSNKNLLRLFFPVDGGCYLIPEAHGRSIRTPTDFRAEFPISVATVPVLGPVEHDEELLNLRTINRGLATHRASRHFRNYWYFYPEGFTEFAELVRATWPGMEILRPELLDKMDSKLVMFANENRIPREIFWAGFGFQIWCQLLTHISRAAPATLLVVDEPEIYLHPDIQRQLLGILREAGPQILLATHSTEIMGEADPSEILLVDKKRRAAQRLRDIEEVQAALEAVGSIQNITLTQLARNRKILFVEGDYDYRVIRQFARQAGYSELAAGTELTAIESGGFSSWQRVRDAAWGFEKTLGQGLRVAAVFDHDYWPSEQIANIESEMNKQLEFVHVHQRKETENYLLTPTILQRAFDKQYRGAVEEGRSHPVLRLLDEITTPLRTEIQAQYIAKRVKYLEKSPIDQATLTTETIRWFDTAWNDLSTRVQIVPGKNVLRALRNELQTQYNVNLTDLRIIDEYSLSEIPSDILDLLGKLEHFRTRATAPREQAI
jgi:energy-coupling factor transporter ATP-binding protein EcfA2